DLLGLAAQDDRPGAGLGLGEHDHALLEVDVLPSEFSDLAEPHERESRQLGDLPERRAHRLEDEDLLLRPQPTDAGLVLGEERAGRKAELRARLLERRTQSAKIPVDRAGL